MKTLDTTPIRPVHLSAAVLAALLAGCSEAPVMQSAGAALSDSATKAPLADESPPAQPTLCKEGSAPVFEGEVEDDLGLAVAVCLAPASESSPALVSVLYSGEGGTREVSCGAGMCGGVIEMTRYTRYRFTTLTLTWRDENGVQTLSETFDAQDTSAPAKTIVTHRWQPREWTEEHGAVPSFPVTPKTEPLKMLVLEPYLLSPD